VYQNIFRHSAVYAVAIAFGKFTSLLLLPVYTRYLTPADYGVLELLDLTSFIITSLVGMRLSDSMLYHYFQSKTSEERDTVLGSAFVGAALVGLAGGAAGWLMAGPISTEVFGTARYASYFRVVFAALAFSLPQDIGYAYLRAQSQSGLYVKLQAARTILAIGLNLALLIIWRMGVGALVWSSLIMYMIDVILVGGYILATARMRFDFTMFRSLGRYGYPIALSGMGMLVIHYGDRIFLRRYTTLAEIGIYALAYKLGMLVSYIQAAFVTHWNAQMFRIAREGQGDRVYVRVLTYYFLIMLFAALALSVGAGPLLRMMVPPAYQPAAILVPVIALAYVLRGVGDYFRSVLLIEKRTGINAWVTLAGVLICLIAYATLIPWLKLWGAVIATLIGFLSIAVMAFVTAQRVKCYRFETGRMLQACGCAVVIFLAAQLIPKDVWWVEAAGVMGCVSMFPLALVATRFFDRTEVAAMWEALGWMRRRAGRLVFSE
jgi:O-antigen/teichoic acid export membrane protein